MTNRHLQHGLSLVELLVTTVLLGIMVFGVGRLIVSGSDAQEYAKRLNRVTEVNQDVLDQVRLELVSSVRLFGSSSGDQDYLDLLDLSGAPARFANCRMPVIRTTGGIGKDVAGAEYTGNMLLFARLAWTDRFRTTSGAEFMTDVYRLVHYYLAAEDGGPAPGSSVGLNLVRFLSEPLIDGGQIDRITSDTDREELLVHLATATPDLLGATRAPAEVVWNRGGLATAVGTLRQIDADTGVLSDTPLSPRTSPWAILPAQDGVEDLLAIRHHSVATVYAPSSLGVGRFGLVDTTAPGFPHGFEVQIVGPTAARQVLLHLVIASSQRRGQLAWSDQQCVVDARDL